MKPNYNKDIFANLEVKPDQTLSETVYHALRAAIVSGQIPAGERINEKALSDSAHISRTPIREALHRLADEKFVEIISHAGAVVSRITEQDVEEIFELRIALDRIATFHAMQNMTEDQFQTLGNLLKETSSLNDEDNLTEVIKNFGKFNNYIYECSNMPRLTMIVSGLRDYMQRLRDVSLYEKARRDKALHEHFLIYEGMVEKNRPVVGQILTEHLTYAKMYLLSEMEQNSNTL
ncbi:GntR family transcriptional regulator [Ligilactobacillus salitolerans]|uniref:GntR family transcriptional regulator n=1 Tax=Ligilactobacillus salitolerans TaxID=1808352 RepID=A0A401IWI9_9LACO|nr:GntR family transcriptional regulator [Ligilactobacillus salitolerans]GBG95882.1 GntR family transcriptional regulator [Ligilactobacillus salitolerans]